MVAIVWFSVCLLFVCSSVTASDDIILPPIKNGQQVSLIFLHGADLSPSAYVETMQAIQLQSELALWIGLPSLNLNIPGSLPKGLDKMKSEMQNQGMETDLYYYGGHSLGTVKIQDYCFEYSANCTGQILMGGTLLRNASGDYFYDKNYPTPTLTIGGELDGLTRVTRMMEGYYHQVLHSTNESNRDFPVIVIEGMTHMQFASGDPSLFVYINDLNPEISYDEAHTQIGKVSADWLSYQITGKSSTFASYLASTDTFLQPLLKAFEMESYYNFIIPCYEKYPDAIDDASCCYSGGGCQCSNNWTPMSITWMADLPAITLLDSDVMHPVSQIPIHLPHVNNTCTSPDATCTLETSTVTENIYGPHTGDNPIYPLAAVELRTKLKSRQALQIAAGIPKKDANFQELDGTGTRCGELNQFVFNWAHDLAASTSSSRYDKLGQRLVFGDDTMETAGIQWINTAMTYNQITLDGEKVIQINSTALASSVSFPVASSAGMHYCKVLSPAYAIEWIYVDGLRLNDGLSSK